MQKVADTIARFRMFEPRETVVVGVSGGPDSVALAVLLSKLGARLCLKVVLAHFNHGVRSESRRDLCFVREMAQGMHLSFHAGVMPSAVLRQKGSLEERLRKQRYDFLQGVCLKTKAAKLAVGHTMDDQAETVLMRVIRGSGLYGLSAILPKRRVGAIDIVRPLIEVGRGEVLAFLKKENIPFRTDETNFEDRFLRNKIRRFLLPYLAARYNPRIKETLSGLAFSVGADYEFLFNETGRFLKTNLSRSPRGYSLPLKSFCALPLALQRMALRLVIEYLKGDLRRVAFRHWREVEEMVFRGPYGSRVSLPSGVAIIKTSDALCVVSEQPGCRKR